MSKVDLRDRKILSLVCKKANLPLLAWPVGVIIYFLARADRDIAENIFARGIFRAYVWLMTHITGWIPFSLAEFLVIAFPVFILTMIVTGIVKTVKNKGKRLISAAGLIRNLLAVAGIVFLWFMIGAGTNYYRYEYAHFSGLERYMGRSTTDELYGLCIGLADRASQARNELTGDEHAFRSAYSDRERAYQGKLAMEKLSDTIPVLKGYYPKPKSVLFSRFMSRFNITGVYFPWTVEANVNVDIPDYSRGAVLCHELSHLRGFMREDEANFIGYLACVNSDSAELRYSGYMLALIYAGNKLYEDSPELYRELYATYSPGMKADLKENSLYWDQFKDKVLERVGEKMNDTYLKINNQTDGTKSYGRMVDLLLAEYRSR